MHVQHLATWYVPSVHNQHCWFFYNHDSLPLLSSQHRVFCLEASANWPHHYLWTTQVPCAAENPSLSLLPQFYIAYLWAL